MRLIVFETDDRTLWQFVGPSVRIVSRGMMYYVTLAQLEAAIKKMAAVSAAECLCAATTTHRDGGQTGDES